jgi:hypothetical protein
MKLRWGLAMVLTAVLAAFAPSAAGAAPSVYTDPAGDAKSAPDIVEIDIADNGNGTISVDIKIAQANLGSDGVLEFFIDSDKSSSTGNSIGADYLVVANSTGLEFEKWDGTQFTPVTHQPTNPSLNGGTDLHFTLTESDIGGATSFNFVAGSVRGNDVDVAPDTGATFPSAAPTIQSILVPRAILTAKAGKVYRVNMSRVQLRLSDDSLVSPDSVSCTLKRSGKALKRQAPCAWKLSKKLKGKTLVLTIAAGYQGETETFTFKVHVK